MCNKHHSSRPDCRSHSSNRRSHCENRIGIDTNIDLTQTANANGGDGGDVSDSNISGDVETNGGEGGDATNTADIEVVNVIVIVCDSDGEGGANTPALTLGLNNRAFNISMDENGSTLLNGRKMDEETFEDGTKMFLFRNGHVKA